MKLLEVNEKLKGSLTGTNNLEAFVDAYYDGFEELKDGFQISDIVSLASSLIAAFVAKELAWAEALDLQDSEINKLLAKELDYDLGDLATEARQILKFILVSIQTYDLLIHEKQ